MILNLRMQRQGKTIALQAHVPIITLRLQKLLKMDSDTKIQNGWTGRHNATSPLWIKYTTEMKMKWMYEAYFIYEKWKMLSKTWIWTFWTSRKQDGNIVSNYLYIDHFTSFSLSSDVRMSLGQAKYLPKGKYKISSQYNRPSLGC